MTESKKLINEAVDIHEDEPVEELDVQKDDAEELAIADYLTKTVQLDAKLEEYATSNFEERKRQAMRRINFNEKQIDSYVKFIEGTDDEEMVASALELSENIQPITSYGEPNFFNGAKVKPVAKDKTEIGRNAIKRVLHKIKL